ncbi:MULTISPECIES: FAD-dependent oxidoreductase [unclassified Mycobacterium]|uniref:FAD-dependent oxidoreductase n=1 Tax=unclassified Mycobacterium TaxID=2642494 RepID=UPI0029C836FA|nr:MULTISPECIES: FAD-dependent monooxygenase [unclassified Mycobacterium]
MEKLGEHAVVLGASMAGLVAARVLAEFFETVTVVERDALSDGADTRRGVPQGRQIHGLLLRGAQVLEELFPGILNELVEAGAPRFDYGDLSQLHFNMGGHLAVQFGSLEGLRAYTPSRPFLESHIRRRVRAIRNIAFLDSHDVVDVTSNTSRDRITGARIVNRHNNLESELRADLVVDATGRGARTPAMLERLGYGRPAEDDVVIHLMYASQLLRVPPESLHESACLVAPVPGRPTGMAMLTYEHDTVMFAVFGMAGNDPPVGCAAMCDFAEPFAPAHILAAMRTAEPLGETAQHRFPSSRWRRYDKARLLPDGLLVVGDAVCSFNPIYGQGMTVAALEALALRKCLSRDTTDLPRRFFRATAKPIGQAWQLAAGGDLSLPEIDGAPPLSTRLLSGYMDRLLTAAEHDTVALEQFLKVAWLVDAPIRLLRPSMMRRAASANRRGQSRPTRVTASAQVGRTTGGE